MVGILSESDAGAVLEALPIDVSFVDAEDRVRYFNHPSGRLFQRPASVIGRKVQQCHPEKSLHVVNRILEDFKTDGRDFAEFWINLHGRLIYIRYFAVRDSKRKYLGCVEAVQDITDMKKIEGERRLL